MYTKQQQLLDLIAFIDRLRRNVERSLKAEDYYSAAFLAQEMCLEVQTLSVECYEAGKQQAKKRVNT